MSEIDVSLIRDEDLLRRMWQQADDFTRKKEIRAHMYRLREERLRSLYNPEPHIDSKGYEFTSSQGHTKSFADQSFQSIKSKEVRDSGSPPREYSYTDRDLKELSNAGWNVETRSDTTEDGLTRVKSVQANIEGDYDINGGKGRFAAIDQQQRAATEYHDDQTSFKKDEEIAKTATHEQQVRQTDDGTSFSSTKTTSSTIQESSTMHCQNDRGENFIKSSKQITPEDQSIHELNSAKNLNTFKKIHNLEDVTKVATETKVLKEDTQVIGAKYEVQKATVRNTQNESHIHQCESEKQKSCISSSQLSTKHTDSKKYAYKEVDQDKRVDVKEHVTMAGYKTDKDISEDSSSTVKQQKETDIKSDRDLLKKNKNDVNAISKKIYDDKVQDDDLDMSSYQTTYQSDYNKKKISTDLSPTHQAWASTLRGDITFSNRDSNRIVSHGSRQLHSSSHHTRANVSPEKVSNKGSSRETSPNKYNKQSPTQLTSDNKSPNIKSSKSDNHTQASDAISRSVSPTKKYETTVKNVRDSKHSQSMSDELKHHENMKKYEDNIKNLKRSPSPTKRIKTAKQTDTVESHESYNRDVNTESTSNFETITSRRSIYSRSPSPSRPQLHSENYKQSTVDYIPQRSRDQSPLKKQTGTCDKKTTPTSSREHSPLKNESEKINKIYKPKPLKEHSPQNVSGSHDRRSSPLSSREQSPIKKRSENYTPQSSREHSPLKNKSETYDVKQTESRYINKLKNSTESQTTEGNRMTRDKNKRRSFSPEKSMPDQIDGFSKTNDKYNLTTNFITAERNAQEISNLKEYVMPPSSSTEESSPTTSVSEIVYIDSPQEKSDLITDLDEQDVEIVTSKRVSIDKRPQILDLKRPLSPTKIPCRSPSPEKRLSTSIDVMPRKSSLKKPLSDNSQGSPVDKPPTTFRISPNEENKSLEGHKIVKKDRPDKSESPKVQKEHPPFTRSETYDQRCRKILGMTDDNSIVTNIEVSVSEMKTISNSSKDLIDNVQNISRPQSPTKSSKENETTVEEHDHLSGQTNYRKEDFTLRSTKIPSREHSPAKLLDVLIHKPVTTELKVNTRTTDFKSTDKKSQPSVLLNSKYIQEPTAMVKETENNLNIQETSNEVQEFITSEREQEVIDRVQKSLRRLSPDRSGKPSSNEIISTSPEFSYIKAKQKHTEEKNAFKNEEVTSKTKVSNDSSNSHSKQNLKESHSFKGDKTLYNESSNKSKSTFVKKPIDTVRTNNLLEKSTKDKIHEKTNSSVTSSKEHKEKTDKSICTISTLTKTTGNNKTVRSSLSNKTTTPTLKSALTINKTRQVSQDETNNQNTKSEMKISRTNSDTSLKTKKITAQRIKSKPEIKLHKDIKDKDYKQTKYDGSLKHITAKKSIIKPKSASALNTTTQDDGIIIDIDRAKSSRENSPERICPTPVKFLDENDTPRLPDEVCEPDDQEFKRTHGIIHETESIVDDIVEISENEELFIKKSNLDYVSKSDECLLSLNEKVTKFSSKIDDLNKNKESNADFKIKERLFHSDHIDEHLKNDSCVLTVNEKVSKFTNAIKDSKNIKCSSDLEHSTSKHKEKQYNIIEPVESIINHSTINTPKKDLWNDRALENLPKSEQGSVCVSDKINKFLKRAEIFLDDNKAKETVIESKDQNRHLKSDSYTKETVSSHAKIKDYESPNLKPTTKVPFVKVTTMRSSEAMKKAKALFENIASSTGSDAPNSKGTKLTDIGVVKKSPKTNSTTALHPSLEDLSPNVTDNESEISFTLPEDSDPQNKLEKTHSKSQVNYASSKSTSAKKSSESVHEVSTRRGSGKFGVELRRTSLERTNASSISNTTERRRSSADNHQQCIEDIYDLDLLDQLLEKVIGYEQRRRIRAQMRVAKKKIENERKSRSNDFTDHSRVRKRPVNITNHSTKSPERGSNTKETVMNENQQKSKSPLRSPSPDKKARRQSPTKGVKATNKFNEYASAYMKKVGLQSERRDSETNKTDKTFGRSEIFKSKLNTDDIEKSKSTSEKTQMATNKRSPSPQKVGKRTQSPVKKQESSPDRLQQRTPSPDFKRPRANNPSVYEIEKKLQTKSIPIEMPTWVTDRGLKKTVTSEMRTTSSKKIDIDQRKKYRPVSPNKGISNPVTSSYGPGPLDAEGKPLFGIKALRNGATNYQVRGAIVKRESHSVNGGEPEGSVSVTAYSTKPEELERLLQREGDTSPSRIHGLAAITTTRRFGGGIKSITNEAKSQKENRSEQLEQFTHNERKYTRQGSVKSLTEKYVKKAGDSRSSERSSYPKAGLILRTSSRGSQSVNRTDSEPSIGSVEDEKTTETVITSEGGTTTTESTTRTSRRTTHESYQSGHDVTQTRYSPKYERSSPSMGKRTDGERNKVALIPKIDDQKSFLDSTTKVKGVQDILTRMKNADIVIEDGDSSEDAEARALLNKFLGATVLMAGMQAYVTQPQKQYTPKIKKGGVVGSGRVRSDANIGTDIISSLDEESLHQLLNECSEQEQRRLIKAQLHTLMAENESEDAKRVTNESLGEDEERNGVDEESGETREEELRTVTSSVRRKSSEKTNTSSTITKTSRVIESMVKTAPKPVSPFTKFRQLEKQNSSTSPKM